MQRRKGLARTTITLARVQAPASRKPAHRANRAYPTTPRPPP